MEAVPGPGARGVRLAFRKVTSAPDDLWTTMELGCGTGLGGGRDVFKAHLPPAAAPAPGGGKTARSSWKPLHPPRLRPGRRSWPSAPNPHQIVALTPHLLENFPRKIGSLILGPLFSPSVHEQLHETFVNQVRPALERG